MVGHQLDGALIACEDVYSTCLKNVAPVFKSFFIRAKDIYSGCADPECQTSGQQDEFHRFVQAICFLTFCYSFTVCYKSKVNIYTCLSEIYSRRTDILYTQMQKCRKARTIQHSTNPHGWMWQITTARNGSPRPNLRKQYHMCKLIYEVLTLGPERISILLGRCFPLGSVSATAYRCFSHAENARLFPPRHE